jgi:hypothetical protein
MAILRSFFQSCMRHTHDPEYPGPQLTDPEQARFQLFESVATLLKNVAARTRAFCWSVPIRILRSGNPKS